MGKNNNELVKSLVDRQLNANPIAINTPRVREPAREVTNVAEPETTEERKAIISVYLSEEKKEKLTDIQYSRRMKSLNLLINEIIDKYLDSL